jgi:hypothetical protein
MQQTIYDVTIKGVTPYMQHRMDDEKLEVWEKRRKKIIERDDVSTEDEKIALYHSYVNDEGDFYLPSEHIRVALINAGAFIKSKVGNARKSMKNIVAAMFTINPEQIDLPRFDTIDKRSAVNKNVKARIVVKRPKWNTGWKVTFKIFVDDDTITKETVADLLDYAGRYVGIGSYRPQNNGPFGRFEVEDINLSKV